MTRTLTLTRPDDWHLHLRDGDALPRTVADAARYMGRAIVMPNLSPPVRTATDARAYRSRILAQLPANHRFQPLMTLYLTDNTTPTTIAEAVDSGIVTAVKLYPAGATTNSADGITSIEGRYPVFEAMAEAGLPLLIHGEVTDDDIDIFDREAVFIDRHLAPLAERLPTLKIVLEHITTEDAVRFISQARDGIAATVTAHHLLFNRTSMFAGGLNPLYYCLPVLKRERHRQALRRAVTGGSPKFFLGTDSAPHPRSAKERCIGCAAGSYTAHAALELYAEVFDDMQALHHLEAFASCNGPDFYDLPRNPDRIELAEQPWTVPERLAFGPADLIPIRAGQTIRWQVRESA